MDRQGNVYKVIALSPKRLQCANTMISITWYIRMATLKK